LPLGDAVNVGSNNSYSVEWLSYKLADIMGVKDLRIEIDKNKLRRCDIDKFQCDNSKLVQYTGWKPKVSMQEGLEQTVQWFNENDRKWSWESFVEGSQIYR
jgi:dTDP-glucose 4,6-dehydratase